MEEQIEEQILYKSKISFCISTNKYNEEYITNMLCIRPTYSYSKGDDFFIKHTGVINKRFKTLWVLETQTIVTDDEDVMPTHINELINAFKEKTDIIKRLKEDNYFTINITIEITTTGRSTAYYAVLLPVVVISMVIFIVK